MLITCFLALPVSAERYEYKNGFSIEIPSTYDNQKGLYNAKNSQVLDNNAWVMQDGNSQCVLMTQVDKNTDNVKIKTATHSQVLEFESFCKQMISTNGYEIDMSTKKEKINGYSALHLYMNEIKDTKGNVLYGDMYIYSSRKYVYYVYFIYSDKNYSTSSEFNNILNSFEIKDKMDLLGGNLVIYIGVIIVATILLLVIIAAKKKQRTVYFNDPGNFNSYQQSTNPYGNNSYQQNTNPYDNNSYQQNSYSQQNTNSNGNNSYQQNSYSQQNTNPYGGNSYQQNSYSQQNTNSYGNNTYQQPNSYNQQSSYPQSDLNNNYNTSSNGYGASSQQDTSEWLSSPAKPVDDNDPNKLADEFWGNK